MRNPLTFRKAPADERGVVAIIVAVSMLGLVIAAALVVDFGRVRLDRQMNKSSADSAVSAGIRGLDRGDGKAHSFAGVCQALAYLRESQPDMAGLPAAGGNVTCPPSAAQLAATCTADNPIAPPARYEATLGGVQVIIQSPYLVSEGGFPEENLESLQDDIGDPELAGCDQLGVIITETTTPGLGRVATNEDLTTSVRSVGRVVIGSEGQGAVALLLLNREECEVLRNSSNNTRILVRGNGPVPGIIHSDSLGSTSCNSTKVFYSQVDYGIVAEESEDEPIAPGIITTRALTGETGANATKAQELFPKVVAKPDPGGATPHGLITRSVVDEKYLPGVRIVRNTANALLDSATRPDGWIDATDDCKSGSTASGRLWLNCANFNPNTAVSFPNATELIFKGRVSGDINMPVATRVYIEGSSSGIHGLSAGQFRMHHFGQATCPTSNVASRAQLVIRNNRFVNSDNSSLVQLCNTAVVLLGGPTATNALPATYGQQSEPNTGTGVLRLTGGTVRWTAPDAVGEEERTTADFEALEDLALWTETSGGSNHLLNANLIMAGIFMAPNASPFNITGTGGFDVKNSQFIVDKLDLGGSGTLEMKPDPHDSITIPIIGGFGLVR
jgi:Flp pilus assembly protein TadG